MPIVRVRENEPPEISIRRFKRACEKDGVLTELRRREFYEKPTSERKRKRAAAVKRWFKKLVRELPKRETHTKAKDYRRDKERTDRAIDA